MIRLMQDLIHWILDIYNYINVFASIFVTFLLTSSYLLCFIPLVICLRTMADGYYFFFLICEELEADVFLFFFNLCNTGNRRYFLWIVSFERVGCKCEHIFMAGKLCC